MVKKPVRIRDVAAKAGVSPGAVSLVMNDRPGVSQKTRQRVLQAAKNLGYVPNFLARGLRRKKSDIVVMVYPTSDSSLFLRILHGVNAQVEAFNYPVVLSCTHDDLDIEARVLGLFRQIAPGGMILAPVPGDQNVELIQTVAAENNIPIVLIERYVPNLPGDFVGSMNAEAAALATRRLLEKGYKKIGCIFNSMPYSVDRERLTGYRQALTEAGITPEPEWVLEVPPLKAWEVEKKIQRYLKDADLPRALLWTIGKGERLLHKNMQELNMVNGDSLEVILFDCDSLVLPIGRPFLNIVQDSVSIGREAIRILGKRMAEEDPDPADIKPIEYRFPCLETITARNDLEPLPDQKSYHRPRSMS